jgi:hypothetical protein
MNKEIIYIDLDGAIDVVKKLAEKDKYEFKIFSQQ